MSNGTKLCIDETLYSCQAKRNLLSFGDIRRNSYHIETTNDDKEEYLYITSTSSLTGKKVVLENLQLYHQDYIIRR